MTGTIGAIFIIIRHGISSPGIFAAANSNYLKTKSRNLLLQKRLSITQPNIIMI